MTDSEVFVFAEIFRNVQRVFPLRGEEHELKQVMGSYFKALRRFPVPAVQAGADVCLQRGKHFPKPAEWIDAIPRASAAPETEALSERDAADLRHAESLHYDGNPCSCGPCRAAGVSERPLRYVPNIDADGRDAQRLDTRTGRLVTIGHWAHGDELARWYAARAQFWNDMIAKFPGLVSSKAKDPARQIAKVFNPKGRLMERLGS